MPKHAVDAAIRSAQSTERAIVERRALSRVNELAPGIGSWLGHALLAGDAGPTTIEYLHPDSDPAVIDLPGTRECHVTLHPSDTLSGNGGVIYGLAEVVIAGHVDFEVRPERKYAE